MTSRRDFLASGAAFLACLTDIEESSEYSSESVMSNSNGCDYTGHLDPDVAIIFDPPVIFFSGEPVTIVDKSVLKYLE